jgi:hypothetical protein
MMVAKDDRVIVGGFANYLNTEKVFERLPVSGIIVIDCVNHRFSSGESAVQR